MKQKKSIYLLSVPLVVNTQIDRIILKNRYYIIGQSKNIEPLYKLGKEAIDILIIFASRKRLSKIDKHQLNFLSHVFKHIVVVSNSKINVLDNYTFLPLKLVGYSLNNILIALENGLDNGVKYSYQKYHQACTKILNSLGFSYKHKGYKYLIYCSYYSILLGANTKINVVYNSLSQLINTSVQSIERDIRYAISCANQKGNLCLDKLSNKKLIKRINQLTITNLK